MKTIFKLLTLSLATASLSLIAMDNTQPATEAKTTVKKININQQDFHGCTALIRAAKAGNLIYLQACLNAGANFDERVWRGRNALMLAAENGHAQCVKALIDAGENRMSWDDTVKFCCVARTY